MDSNAWLSTNHLKLTTSLSQKLASHYIGLFKVIDQIYPVTFRPLLPDNWKLYDVFHALQLKPVVGFVRGLSGVTPSAFWLPADDSGKFEIENILDSRLVHHSH